MQDLHGRYARVGKVWVIFCQTPGTVSSAGRKTSTVPRLQGAGQVSATEREHE